MANIANNIVNQAEREFKLSYTPLPGTLKVFINNAQVAVDGINGYTYLSASQTVQLNGTAMANAQGGVVRIEYLRN